MMMEEYLSGDIAWHSAISWIVLTGNLVIVLIQFLHLEENGFLRYRFHICCYRQDRHQSVSTRM